MLSNYSKSLQTLHLKEKSASSDVSAASDCSKSCRRHRFGCAALLNSLNAVAGASDFDTQHAAPPAAEASGRQQYLASLIMDRLKRLCIRSQYLTAVLALLIYSICWNLDIYIFAWSFLVLGSISMLQVMLSALLIVIDRKDIAFWRRDMQLLAGAFGLTLLHLALLLVLKQINWA